MINQQNDEQIEIWDWETGQPTGKTAQRSLCHKQGIPHEGVHLWILSFTDEIPYLLFQLRASHKDMFPNVLDITVGGHVPFGLKDNKIQKEAYEEIGIIPHDSDLIDLGYYRYEEKEQDFFHREFQHLYLLVDNRPLSTYSFIDKEVSALFAVPYSFVKKIMRGDLSVEARGFDGIGIFTRILTKKDFHPLLFADSMKNYINLLFDTINKILP